MKHMNLIKRFGAILLCLVLMLSLSALTVAAEDEVGQADIAEDAANSVEEPIAVADSADATATDTVSEAPAATEATVLVTIADATGALALAAEPITVTDIDADGLLTINDALYCAHEDCYEGGAAAGYASEMSDFGLSLAKLWGAENGGSYGYYVNDVAAWGLADPVADGDRVNAFVYTDLTAWSDTYCYFDVAAADAKAGDTLTLTLSAAGFDADWNPVTLPVAGATITVNGEKTEAVTDENGKATITLTGEGELVISAVSDAQVLVPPVCVVTLEEEEVSEEASYVEAVEYETNGVPAAPATGDATGTVAAITLLGALCVAGLTVSGKRREK